MFSPALHRSITTLVCGTAEAVCLGSSASAQQSGSPAQPAPAAGSQPAAPADNVFRLGEIVYVLGQDPGTPGVGGSVVTHEQLQTFERNTLDQAVNLVPRPGGPELGAEKRLEIGEILPIGAERVP